MFPFKKPPSRVELARKAVTEAVAGAAHSLSGAATEAAATVAHAAESLSERAHDLIEGAPIEASVAGAAEKVGALKAGAATALAGAGAELAGRVASAREKVSAEDVPDVRRARKTAQAQINDMNQQAQQYKRELEKELARQQADFESEKARIEREAQQLAAQQLAAQQLAAQRARRTQPDQAPTGEVYDYDQDGEDGAAVDYGREDFEEDYGEKKGGGNGWLLLGGLLLAGAGAVYYLFSTTGGKRSKAAIQDRIGQVKEGAREAATHSSDASDETVIEAASDALDRSNEKIGAPVETGGAELPDKAAEKMGEVSDKVAGGIEAAGDFIADKLEAAGAGAKSAAHSATGKLDETKAKIAQPSGDAAPVQPKPTTLGAVVPTGAPADAVVVEIVSQEPLTSETTEEILAEVEATVQNIEDSARPEKR